MYRLKFIKVIQTFLTIVTFLKKKKKGQEASVRVRRLKVIKSIVHCICFQMRKHPQPLPLAVGPSVGRTHLQIFTLSASLNRICPNCIILNCMFAKYTWLTQLLRFARLFPHGQPKKNKLASLEATLVRNSDPEGQSVECINVAQIK